MKFSVRIIFCLALLSSSDLFSQYLFSYLGTEAGLSSREITCFIEDKEGYIWFGTNNGLNRFDGSRIKVYNHANHNYPSSLNESIEKIIEYDQGTFIIGTSNGLVCFDYYHHQFTPIDLSTADYDKEQMLSVHNMVIDPFQRVWITSNQGLFVYINGKVLNAHAVLPELNVLDSLIFSSAAMLDVARNGMWIGTTNGLRFFNYLTGTVWSHKSYPDSIPVFKIYAVDAGTLDPKTGDIYWGDGHYIVNKYDAKSQSTYDITYPDLKGAFFNGRTFYKDRHERLWVSTWQWATFVIEPDSTLIRFPKHSNEYYPLDNVFILDMMETRNGDLWLATSGGAYKLSSTFPVTHIFNISPEEAAINKFVRMSDYKWIVAKENGLILFDENTGQITQHLVDPANQQANRIFDITKIENEWWCGTGNGVKIFNPEKGTFKSLPDFEYSNEINSRSVMQVLKDRKGNIWISTWANYIYKYNPLNNECIRYDGSKPLQGDIGKTNCLAITEASDGRIWVAHLNKGIRVFDHRQNAFHNPVRDSILNASVVNGIVKDHQNHMWLTTDGNGIYEVSPEGKIVSHFTTEHGLSSNKTNSMTIDQHNMLWFAAPEAIHYLKPGAARVETIRLGIKNSIPNYWMHMEVTDRYNYAAVYGQLFRIDLGRILIKQHLEPPLITGISIFEEEFPFSPLNPSIDLNYTENFFRIEYSSTQHDDNPSIQYEYQLTGFDGQWVKTGRNISASYTNVPPGTYTFKVRAFDRAGLMSSDAAVIPIHIKPPFWQTIWFYMFCGAIVIALAYELYRYQYRRGEKKKGDQIIDYFANSVYGENAVNEICWDIARNCISQLGFKECVVYLTDHAKKELIETASFSAKNPKGTDIPNPRHVPFGKDVVGYVAEASSQLVIPDTSKHESHNAEDEIKYSILAVPIIHDQQVIGVIEARDEHKQFFTDMHLKTLNMIASISALKIADAKAEIARKQNELKLLEINKLFTESQLKALRAQMNPHFVFNCLNSIQECIVTEKFSEASTYLNKFAKLFRQVLNNSGKMLITIEEEVEILKLYLELESMRFDHSFNYTIEIDPLLEADYVLVPSMFLQPFVENALWHGLMHKQNDRTLKISFKKLSEEVFSCTVEDNGIGRKKSIKRKQSRGVTHKYESKGMKMTEERLDVLRRQNYHAQLSIEDTSSAEDSDTGTRVIVELSTSLSNL